MPKIIKKQFIAGATCPQCGAMDEIYTYQLENDDTDRAACMACDYQSERPNEEEDSGLNQEKSDDQISVVKLSNPIKRKPH